jgi:hypothetical protein
VKESGSFTGAGMLRHAVVVMKYWNDVRGREKFLTFYIRFVLKNIFTLELLQNIVYIYLIYCRFIHCLCGRNTVIVSKYL